jgi:hypothetical protein
MLSLLVGNRTRLRFGSRRIRTRSTDATALLELIHALAPVRSPRELIRLGPPTDGGYLVPDDLEGIRACFSPGVNKVSDFELDCANRGMQVFLADRSVDGPAVEHPSFSFTKRYLGAFTDDAFMTMDDWVNESLPGNTDDLLLQMDIEGFEYEVLLATSESLLQRFRILVCEFHWLDDLFSQSFFRTASRVFHKLLQTHACVHIHPNNDSGVVQYRGVQIPHLMEFTFLRKDRVGKPASCTRFPHPLDADNCAKPGIRLPACWYAH